MDRAAAQGEPVPRAARTSEPLRLDGAPDEPAWLATDSITDFRQRDPAEGQPATERTVVRLLSTAAGLWVAFWCYDSDPAGIRHSQLRRDADLDFDDHAGILIDAQRDKRSAFVFGTNANGALWDGEVINRENDNEDWNGVWDARGRVTPFGWTAELFIPWQVLRYPASQDRFGVNFVRYIRRKNEEVLWRAWRRQQGLLFLAEEGAVTIEGPLPPRGRFEARPYASLTAEADTRGFDTTGAYVVTSPSGSDVKVGGDAKIAVAPTLTMDLTVNTDFAQVESDDQVINLSRFPVFFPEQRQFFLEAAQLFDLGESEATQLFHSRRIGLDAGGNPIPIIAGSRLIGRVGKERLGLLAVRTGEGEFTAENAVDVVARIQHDVFSRGYVGAMGTLQDGPGVAQRRLGGGLDFNFPFLVNEQNLIPGGYVAATDNGAGRATSWRLFLDYPNDNMDHFVAVSRTDSLFDPSLGFVRQAGIWNYRGAVRFYPRPGKWGIRRFALMPLFAEYITNLDGSLNNASYETSVGAEFESGDEISVFVSHDDDVPADTFDLFPGTLIPPGRYGWNRAGASLESSGGRPVSVELGLSVGDFYTGTGQEFEYDVSARLEPHLIAGVEGSWQWIQGDSSSFTAQVHRLRLDYAANPRLNTTLFLQWDNESERLAVNARLHWIPRPGSDAYLVWNTTWPTGMTGGVPWQQPLRGALIGKLVYYFRW